MRQLPGTARRNSWAVYIGIKWFVVLMMVNRSSTFAGPSGLLQVNYSKCIVYALQERTRGEAGGVLVGIHLSSGRSVGIGDKQKLTNMFQTVLSLEYLNNKVSD